MAFTAVAALAAGAEVTATLVLAAAAEVGTAMTVIGAVTGNKELMKIGGAVALVGGVGGMINGAIGGAAAEGAAVGAEGAVANEAATAADYVNAADAMSDAATVGAEATGGIVSGGAPAGTKLASNTVMQTPGQEMAQATSTPAAASSASPTINGPTQMAPEIGAPQGPAGAQAPEGPMGAQAPTTPWEDNFSGSSALGTSAPQDSGSFFGRFSDWANKNKTLFQSGMQLAGGALSGMNQRQMWNQKMALEQQRINQTSHGSDIGVWAPRGIVTGAH
jgi:hypothetical protein